MKLLNIAGAASLVLASAAARSLSTVDNLSISNASAPIGNFSDIKVPRPQLELRDGGRVNESYRFSVTFWMKNVWKIPYDPARAIITPDRHEDSADTWDIDCYQEWVTYEHVDIPYPIEIHPGNLCKDVIWVMFFKPYAKFDNLWIKHAGEFLNIPTDFRCDKEKNSATCHIDILPYNVEGDVAPPPEPVQ